MAPLSLLVVDISIAWEEEFKAQERGYFIDQSFPGREYKLADWWKPHHRPIQYPYGSTRAGLDAIIDTVRIAHEYRVPIYSVNDLDPSNENEDLCYSLQPYIPKKNRYFKYGYSAFLRSELAANFHKEKSEHLLIIGYDRDCCVLESVKDAVSREIKVATSEHCMLTANLNNDREGSLAFYRERTIYLDSVFAVWNFIRNTTRYGR